VTTQSVPLSEISASRSGCIGQLTIGSSFKIASRSFIVVYTLVNTFKMASVLSTGLRSGRTTRHIETMGEIADSLRLSTSNNVCDQTCLRHRYVYTVLPGCPTVSDQTARPISNTAIALRPNTPSASINTADSTPSTTNPVTRIAQAGSNQLSLETPRNGAGKHAR